MGTLLLDAVMSGQRGTASGHCKLCADARTAVIREVYEVHLAYAAMLFVFVLMTNVTMMGVLAGLLVKMVRKC